MTRTPDIEASIDDAASRRVARFLGGLLVQTVSRRAA